MKFLQIIAHPRVGSLSHQMSSFIAQSLRDQGHQVIEKDLYQEGFSPVLHRDEIRDYEGIADLKPELQEHVKQVLEADFLLFFYPVWWWERPAILKGWFDRIFARNLVFRVSSYGIQGCLKAKGALVVQTFGDSERNYREGPGHLSVEGGVEEGTLKVAGIDQVEFFQLFSTFALKQEDVAKAKKDLWDKLCTTIQ